jgi:ABC-type sugar transport system ATPase subunit
VEPIIQVSHLTKYYGKSLGIEDINLEIHKGEIFGFLGPNGAGKSTMIRLMLNLLRPSLGSVKIFNKNVLYDYLQKFNAMGKTIFFSSHYLAEVEKICDRVGLVKNGKLITCETISSLKEKMIRRLEVTFAQAFLVDDFDLQINIADYGKAAFVGFVFFLSMGSMAIAICSFQIEKGKALGKTIGLIVALYFFDTIIKLSKSLDYLYSYSYFQLYQPGKLVQNQSDAGVCVLISLVLTGLFLMVGILQFNKRDL